MANHKSSAKRARQTIVKTLRNRVINSETKTIVKKVRAAIAENDKATATTLFATAQRQLDLMAKKGIIKPNSAGRRTARLASQINGL